MSYQEIKVCILGDSGVGKSSIARRFVHNTFSTDNESTIGASFMTKTFVVNNRTFKLNIWDTAGQEQYKAVAPLYYRNAAACVVVYDVTSMTSFLAVKNWVKILQSHVSPKIILALAGNKSDLNDRRQVPVKEAKAYADTIGAIFVETSARNCSNISQLFCTIVSRLPNAAPLPTSLVNLNESVSKGDQQRCCGSNSKNSV